MAFNKDVRITTPCEFCETELTTPVSKIIIDSSKLSSDFTLRNLLTQCDVCEFLTRISKETLSNLTPEQKRSLDVTLAGYKRSILRTERAQRKKTYLQTQVTQKVIMQLGMFDNLLGTEELVNQKQPNPNED